jgi:FkbM family methyltransferase
VSIEGIGATPIPDGHSMSKRRYGVWARAVVAPRRRMLPALGHRLGRHPRMASSVLVGLRRMPVVRLRTVLYENVSRPLVSRMDAELVVPVRGGSRMLVDTSDMMGRVIAASGVWEPHVTAMVSTLLSAGDVCVDVGAHTGYHTMLAARLVGPGGRVYALEPAPAANAALRANVALNSAANVTVLRIAAGETDGRATIVTPPSGNSGEASTRIVTTAGLDLRTDEVLVHPVASVVDDSDVPRLRLVKIDVEGYEAEVLEGIEPLFVRGSRPAVIVEVHPHRVRETIAAMERLQSAFSLRAFELVRVPTHERFAEVPPPRELVSLERVEELCRDRTLNVVLLADGARLGR